MPDIRKNGDTSNLMRFVLKNSSTGQGLTGLTSASSGLIISTIADVEATAVAYTAGGSTIESITTLGTFATPTTNKCRFKEVDSTNHPGLYEFQFANARFAVSNAKRLVVTVSGATNLLAADYEIEFTPSANIDQIGGAALNTSSAQIGVNIVSISGDATAADNLEAYTDGTTPIPANVTHFGGTAGSFTSGRPNVQDVIGSIGALSPQAVLDVNGAVDDALNTAIPGSPTADSINERVKTMDDNYTATRAGYLANINNANLLNVPASPSAVGSAMTLTSAYDLYHADIQLVIDAANSKDEWLIHWYKNGIPQTSGITVPTLQVIKRADGTDLIASVTPSQIASTGVYKHDATTTARTTAGEGVLAIVTATIDGSTRTWRKALGRDSSA